MNKDKTLIFLNDVQYGYDNNTHYYASKLKSNYSIIYFCWDQGLPRIEADAVKIIYVNRDGNLPLRNLRLFFIILKAIRKNSYPIVFIKYIKIIPTILRLVSPESLFVIDIRSSAVFSNLIKRYIHNFILKFEARLFKNITIISQSLALKLKLPKAHILPIGADILSDKNRFFDDIHLIYVGTLNNRNIDITIHGFKLFFDRFNDQASICYTIIGSGSGNEEHSLRQLVIDYGLTDIVNIVGKIPHNQLQSYFDTANIGISYIPIKEYYDVQPPTKTFEYLLSGMPVVATNTLENAKVINSNNGVLISDTVGDFYDGLKTIFYKRHMFDSVEIRENSIEYTWENIVKKNLKVYLEGLHKIHTKKSISES